MNSHNSVFILRFSVILIGLIMIGKLFYLQIINEEYALKAENISKREVTITPHRGLIKDRLNKTIVHNGSSYNLLLNIPFDTSGFDKRSFCDLIQLPIAHFDSILSKRTSKSFRSKAVFIKNMNMDLYARIQEGIFKFPQFEIESLTSRRYVQDIAAHALGYLAAINRKELRKDKYYHLRDYIGKSGIEKYYENVLRGEKGKEIFLINKLGQVEDRYRNGNFDIPTKIGKNITSSIDSYLQLYGEKLMEGKRGSIVAIEPKTGEILSMVSTPGYPPSYFEDINFSKQYSKLVKDPEKPLANRATAAQYSPGSVFKLVMALIGLQEGVITPSTRYNCNGGFKLGNLKVRCHNHAPRPNLNYSIQTSCNAYYCNLFRDLLKQDKFNNIEAAYNNWRRYLVELGLGSKLDVDVDFERRGSLPTSDYYHRIHGKNRWNYSRIISLSIGQGELELTPVQMANLASAIANKGYYIKPHLIKAIDGNKLESKFKKKHFSSIKPEHFETVIEGMHAVYQGGTATHCNLSEIAMCGKTGTVQNVHGKNHSIFIAFAPKDDPKIAIAVVVENAGYGSTWAAPIASLMIEKYIVRDSFSSNTYLENKMLKPMVFIDYD